MSRRSYSCISLALLAGSLVAGAAAQQTSYSQPFYGSWYTYPLGNPNTDPIRHEFRHNATTGKDEMIVSRRCQGDYKAVTAKAVVPIEISESNIQVLKTATDTQDAVGHSVCRASVDAGTWSYSVSDDGSRITITNPGGNPDILELARQDPATESVMQSRVYGTWLVSTPDGDTKVETRFVFYGTADPDMSTVREIVSCRKGRDSLLAQADSDAKIGKDQISVLESASHDERLGNFVCTAAITAADLHYEISPDGSILTLSKAGQKPLVLTRER